MVASFTGQGSEFEEPDTDCLIIDSEKESPEQSADRLLDFIKQAITIN